MLFAVLIATLTSIACACAVVLGQSWLALQAKKRVALQREIAQFARSSGGRVTPASVSEQFGMAPWQADDLLREMVDDVHVRMMVNDRTAALEFRFPTLAVPERSEASAAGRPRSRPRSHQSSVG